MKAPAERVPVPYNDGLSAQKPTKAAGEGNYIENTGYEPVRFLEMFKSDRHADVSLNQWLALTRPELVQAHLNVDPATVASFSRTKPVTVRE